MELAAQSSSDGEADQQRVPGRWAMAAPRCVVPGALFMVVVCACILAVKVSSKKSVQTFSVTEAGLTVEQSIGRACPAPPEIGGQNVGDLIGKSQSLLVLGMPNMRCTLAFRGEAASRGIAYDFREFSGQ